MVLPEVRQWLDRRNSSARDWPAARLCGVKGDTRVSVVLPARDEEATVGDIVRTVRRDLVDGVPLVDEIVVIDSHSADATARVAADAGAKVVDQDEILPELPRMSGKGEALWKSLAITTGDVLVFIDADLKDFPSHFVSGLVGPLLTDPSIAYVKGFYERPLIYENQMASEGGGRVTELVARPLINLYWPLLAGVVQPLSGEYAGRRRALERVPFVSEYGVELGLLIDLVDMLGLDALAQVDLGKRIHTHQSTEALGRMSGHILQAAWARLARDGRASVDGQQSGDASLAQFRRIGDRYELREVDVSIAERPPMVTIPAYARGRHDGRQAASEKPETSVPPSVSDD